jgi:hypothetical protein
MHHWYLSWHWWLLWHTWLRHSLATHLVWWISVLSLVVVRSSALLSHSVVSVIKLLWSFVLLHQLEELLDDLSQVWLTCKIIPLETTSLLLSVFFEISFIFKFIHLNLSDFLDFVIVDDQNFTIIDLVREGLFSLLAGIWLLEANESVLVTSWTFLKSDVFKFTKL